jgi:hypothetical protein
LAFFGDPLGDAVTVGCLELLLSALKVGIVDGVGAFVALSLFGRSFLDGASFFSSVGLFVDPPMALGTLELPILLGEAVAILLGEAVVMLMGEAVVILLGGAVAILLGAAVAGIALSFPLFLPMPMPIPILPVVGEEVGDGWTLAMVLLRTTPIP